MTEDLNEAMDLSNNDITRLENFPVLNNLKTLLASNNRIFKIDERIAISLPKLESLVLTNNQITSIDDLRPLSGLKHLTSLCLVNNPITHRYHNYRVAVAAICPNLLVLDRAKVSLVERRAATILSRKIAQGLLTFEQAAELIDGGSAMEDSKQEAKSARATVPARPSQSETQTRKRTRLTEEQQKKLRDMIEAASSLEELERLAEILSSGNIPDDFVWE